MTRIATMQATRFLTGYLSLLLSGLLAAPLALAGQNVISDDGREVRLEDDGSWVFVSNDRFATTPDGRRVRLKSDGRWEYADSAAPPTARAPASPVTTGPVTASLAKVEIEIAEEKSHKNVRRTLHSVFYLQLQGTGNTDLQASLEGVTVSDDRGNDYPVLSVKPATPQLSTAKISQVVVRAEGAPTLWNRATAMTLTIPPGSIGNTQAITLRRDARDMQKKKVDSLD
jgi:hypothetical protein